MSRWRIAVAAMIAMTALNAATMRAQTDRPKLLAPLRGEARIGHLKPDTKVVGKEVVTVFQVKNLSQAPVAGLKIEEFWFDKTNNLVPGAAEIVKKPIQPGEIVTVTLRTPRDPRMNRNSYRFSHANGTIKTELLATLEPKK